MTRKFVKRSKFFFSFKHFFVFIFIFYFWLFAFALTSFFFPNSWSTLGWPHKILGQIGSTEEQLQTDEQKFQKKLVDDQAQLDDKLDTLQV